MNNNQLISQISKSECELSAFERLAERLKEHFPKLKIIVFMDALYATQGVMGILHKHHWDVHH